MTPSTQATADTDTGPVTFINIFELDPRQLDAFLVGWRERAEFMSRQPGFRRFASIER